jgi:hypothetical protein
VFFCLFVCLFEPTVLTFTDSLPSLFLALCTPADTYNLDFKDLGITPQQKAAIIGEMVHLDFLFFEADQPICRQSDDGKTCYILLCTCYCLGALCPIQCCCHSENN